jgi:hypothetical protein
MPLLKTRINTSKKRSVIKVKYILASSLPVDVEHRLNKAFDVLFECVLRNYQANKNKDEK